MTFNNIEIPNDTYTQIAPNWEIFDGTDIALIHDGTQRHLIIKNIETAVTLKEPNTSGDPAFLIGGNSTNVFIANPNNSQLRTLLTTGTVLGEQFINLNSFNKYKDLQYVGTNTTQNVFKLTCGTVVGTTVVVGGYLDNPSPGLTVNGVPMSNGAICYMFSNDSGETFQGPYFPFVNMGSTAFLVGQPFNIVTVSDNWYFYIGYNPGGGPIANISLVQSLGVDLIGDNIFPSPIEDPANLTNYQLPAKYFDNKIFYQDTNRLGYYVFDLVLDTISFSSQANITAFTVVGNDLFITTLDNCLPIQIAAQGEVASNIVTNFMLGGAAWNLTLQIGQTAIAEETNINSPLYNNTIDSDHFTQPANIQ